MEFTFSSQIVVFTTVDGVTIFIALSLVVITLSRCVDILRQRRAIRVYARY